MATSCRPSSKKRGYKKARLLQVVNATQVHETDRRILNESQNEFDGQEPGACPSASGLGNHPDDNADYPDNQNRSYPDSGLENVSDQLTAHQTYRKIGITKKNQDCFIGVLQRAVSELINEFKQ